jgi:hypothetical protein
MSEREVSEESTPAVSGENDVPSADREEHASGTVSGPGTGEKKPGQAPEMSETIPV